MATIKKRINISLPKEAERLISLLAKRDRVPEATKALEFLEKGLMYEEDYVWAKLADIRFGEKSKHINHKQAWQ